jgi:rhodanese-related sulfurtransferase
MVRAPREVPVAAPTSGAAVRLALRQRTEIGLLDVRPEGPFAEGHPLFAASFPLGRLEGEVSDRLPRRSVPLVVYGDAAVAAGRLQGLAYRDVSLLEGGLAGWVAGGGELFRDVNAPQQGVRGAGRLPPPAGAAAAAASGSPSRRRSRVSPSVLWPNQEGLCACGKTSRGW